MPNWEAFVFTFYALAGVVFYFWLKPLVAKAIQVIFPKKTVDNNRE